MNTPAVVEKAPSTDQSEAAVQKLHQELLSAVLFLCTLTHPTISAVVKYLCRYSSSPKKAQFASAKRLLCYLKGTVTYALRITRDNGPLVCYVDRDWAGDLRFVTVS